MEKEAPEIPSFSAARRWSVGINVALTIAAMLALVAMANYLAIRHYHRDYWTSISRPELSPRTLQVLRSLTNNVKAIVYFDSDDDLYPRVLGLLRDYQEITPRLQVQVIDYLRDAAAAKIIQKRYRLAQSPDETEIGNKNLVIFDGGEKMRVVSASKLSDYDVEGLISQRSKEVQRTHFKGELLFTSAIYSVSYSRWPKAYFLTGHGEHLPDSTDEQTGYSKFAALLQDENNVQVAKLSLLGTNEISSDCNLLIVAGPSQVIPADELEKIQRYLEQGGRLLVLFNYMTVGRRVGLEKLLQNWSIGVGDNVVIDAEHSPTATGRDVIPSSLGTHPIVRPLANQRLHLLLARSINKAQSGSARGDEAKAEELLFTGRNTVVRTDVRNEETYTPSEKDRRGPTPLMVAVEKGNIPGVSSARGTTRLAVVGDSIFLGNQMIESGANRDFASYTINWLLDQSQLLSEIPRRAIKTYKLTMTPSQLRSVQWILLLVMPGSVLLVGLVVWASRRK